MIIIPQETARISDIVSELRAGKTLVYPTETCYGLGCNALDADAVARVFAIKQRQKDKTVLVLMADEEMAMEYVVWNETLERIARMYWPGPLTVVAESKSGMSFPRGILGSRGMLAFRITGHQLASELVRALGRPLVSTSANIASEESPYDIDAVIGMFSDKIIQPDIVIDAGVLPHHNPSTIVRIQDQGVVVLRQGEVQMGSDFLAHGI